MFWTLYLRILGIWNVSDVIFRGNLSRVETKEGSHHMPLHP